MKEMYILVFLGINAWTDIRKREISLISVLAAGIAGIVWSWQDGRSLLQIGVPIVITLVFLMLSLATGGDFGMGDVWMILAFGMLAEAEEFIMDVCMGMLFAGVWSVILIVGMQKSKSTEIPFVPFLMAGYVGGLIIW